MREIKEPNGKTFTYFNLRAPKEFGLRVNEVASAMQKPAAAVMRDAFDKYYEDLKAESVEGGRTIKVRLSNEELETVREYCQSIGATQVSALAKHFLMAAASAAPTVNGHLATKPKDE